jgi:hypothetical protein
MFRPDPSLEPARIRPRLVQGCARGDDRGGAMTTTHPIEDLRRSDLPRRWARFVVVNDRVPRANANCTMCGGNVERGYVRDPQTRMVYCDAQCFTELEQMASPATVEHARKVL